MELVNFHCHSGFCGHGEGALEDYLQTAKDRGITSMAFTEHFPLSLEMDPTEYLSVPERDMEAYCQAVERLQQENPDMDLLLGIELDYLGDGEDRVFEPGTFDRFQVILGSVHFVDKWAFDDPSDRSHWEIPGMPEKIWNRYFELWCNAVGDTRYPFQIMSHPDLPKKFAYYPSFDLQPLYDQAAEAAAAADKMIEVNTSGAHYACKEMFPAPALLETFRKAGVPCSVGTDAHVPENVDRGIKEAYDLMRKAGYREVTVLTSTSDRRAIPLD